MGTKDMEIAMGFSSLILLALTLPIILHNCVGEDTLALGSSLMGDETIVSKNGTFELGFFTPTGTNNWYLGIWYAQFSPKTIVWVANRQTPLRKIPALLELSREGYLGLFDADGASVWSAKGTKKASLAMVLDSGNFVMLGTEDISETVWQSFDHPADTWLPEMKFSAGQKFVCWKNHLDPAPGLFSFHFDYWDLPYFMDNQFSLHWKDYEEYLSNSSQLFSDQIPKMANKYIYKISKEKSNSRPYITYTVTPESPNVLSRFLMDMSGRIELYTSIDGDEWRMIWSEPKDPCDVYGLCGAYGRCTTNNSSTCSCLDGFMPKDNGAWGLGEWSSGCVLRRPLQCSATNGTTDGLSELRGISFVGESSFPTVKYETPQACQVACLKDCDCKAVGIRSDAKNTFSCSFWLGDLLTTDSSDGQSLFIRLPASLPSQSSKAKITKFRIVGILCGAFAGVAAMALLFAAYRRRRSLILHKKHRDDSMTTFLTTFTFKELKIATRNFRNKLGSGAFGSVFKGTLPDGTLVAVKKLEGTRHGEKQFRAEISTGGNIQHVNVVRLVGFCAEGSRRLLVYEYMPNGSLNSFLSSGNSKREKKVLDWNTRFQIALGTARGLVYLHEECRDRIIHCDIKPENILLDADFSPKLADFGLAKLVGRNFSRVLTTTRGTRGYLAPEWISGLPITPKADVYSFGMTLLEIISGRRNLDLFVQESRYYFPTWAASQIHKGNVLGIVDEKVAENMDVEEVRRAALVSMLCIQDEENVRPSMAQVVLMLEGRTELGTPQIPSTLLMGMDHDQNGANGTSSTMDIDTCINIV